MTEPTTTVWILLWFWYICIIYTPNLGLTITVFVREREQGRFRGNTGGSKGEHEGVHEGVLKEEPVPALSNR